jgi:rubrerythrin
MTTARDNILGILKKAYQIEVDGYTFYSMTADRADKPAVQELFGKLASDELQHKAFLREIIGNYDERGVAAFALRLREPDLRSFSEQVFTARFREQAEGATFEAGVLSVGLTLESNAISHFSVAASRATEKEVRQFYQFLADWEQQHFDALKAIFEAVKADFWAESGFAPF